jgi:hypothetical protein
MKTIVAWAVSESKSRTWISFAGFKCRVAIWNGASMSQRFP